MQGRTPNAGAARPMQGRTLKAGPHAQCRAVRSMQGRTLNAGPYAECSTLNAERCQADETCRKSKGKGNGGKGEHGNKGDNRGKGLQQSVREEEEERGRVAPNMEAGGSHPQTASDPGKKEKKKETRVLRWADLVDEEQYDT